MTDNLDIILNFEEDTPEQLVELYIRTTMSSASLELFERARKYPNMNLMEAAGNALLNESIVTAVRLGMALNKAPAHNPETEIEIEEEINQVKLVDIVVNSKVYSYPVGTRLTYEDIAMIPDCFDPVPGFFCPVVDIISPTRESKFTLEVGECTDITEDGLIIEVYER